MASLVRIAKFARPLVSVRGSLAAPFVRSKGYWNKDWKPGPYPVTQEERIAAAKKYGLRPEDYEPYPDDGYGYGDYPMLPRAPAEARDPFEDYDMPEYKRNYGEPLHVDFDLMTEDKWNPHYPYRYSMRQMKFWFLSFVLGFALIYYLAEPYPHFHPAMDKQFPNKGEVHYTFEPAD